MLLSVLLYITLLYNVSFISTIALPDTNSIPSASGRIINGQNATVGQFPFQVGVLAKIDSYDGLVQAAGSVISRNYVLTVAHAVVIDGMQYIEVHFGVLALENPDIPRKIMTIYENGFIPHKDYRTILSRRFNDIALLKLPEPIEFTATIQPIALPTRADANISFEGSQLRIAGWGRYTDANRNASLTLKYNDVDVIEHKICKHFFREFDPSTMFCISTWLNKAVCGGDSGGASIYTDPKTKRQFAAGLVSFGFYTCAADGFPQVFLRVASYLDWIAENTDIEIL